MTKTLRSMHTAIGLAILAAAIAPLATACDGKGAPSASPYVMQAAYRPARLLRVADQAVTSSSIVGMWAVRFVAENSPGTPDGTVSDWGYTQWHSDGTEIENSGARSPSTENFCLGVWTQTGPSSYRLTHHALSYDATSGALNGYVTIQEQVTLASSGNNYSGLFTLNVVDPSGNPVSTVKGIIVAQRLTADQ